MEPKIGFRGTSRENIIKDLYFAVRHKFNFYEISGLAKNFDLEPSYVKEIRGLSEENNISLNMHVPYFLPISSAIPEVAEGALEFAKKEVILAKELGVKRITIHSGPEEAPGKKIFRQKILKLLFITLGK